MVGLRKVLLTILVSVYTLALYSQSVEEHRIGLAELSKQAEDFAKEQRVRAYEYAIRHNVPLSYRDDKGNLVLLVGVSESGLPMYESTLNAGAAITSGAAKLREGGSLGLNLQGDGITVAVWDGGIVDSHIEFGDRILSVEGSAEDAHATHVTGTILAAGLNAQAKGMAPKAKAFTYDFANDTPEMSSVARPDQSTIILSNHSYGLITGWRFNAGSWQWFGDAGISNQEDWRFGFYSSAAAQWDQLAFNAPYYLIVKSAGNDRSDTGNGSFPPDCNGGSGYDCIADKSVAKNILTVGAVNKVPNYADAGSVVMSSFSSWGPTDDGRIKPDLVAAGVNIFSTIASTSDDAYGSLSGTSMAAPSATGSLALLQELYKSLNGGNFMRASTLKALAIHAVKEAGPAPGPDYQFGWGLLDVEEAARLILNEDNQNIIIAEEVLQNGQPFELTLQPKANTKITATIVWTDRAGTPVGASLDPPNLMLVNDLDMRLVDDAGNTQFPWILNPGDPGASATRGDNFRDNVEKIEFSNPEPRTYKLRINHKGTLVGGQQQFSLIVQYTSVNDPRTALYWIGNNGNWNNPANWSYTSGGTTAGVVPTISNRVIVDENSFSGGVRTININSDVFCHSITWLTKSQSGITFESNSNTLTVAGSVTVSSNAFAVQGGTIRFTGSSTEEYSINLASSDFSSTALTFDGENSTWQLIASGSIGTIELIQGNLLMREQTLAIGKIISITTGARVWDITNSVISGVDLISLVGSGLTWLSEGSKISDVKDFIPSTFNLSTYTYLGEFNISGTRAIQTTGMINRLNVFGGGFCTLGGTTFIQNVLAEEGSTLRFQPSSKVLFGENTVLNSSTSNKTELLGMGVEATTSELRFEGHFKLCFDNLKITNLNVAGTAVINAGVASELLNAQNWLQSNCNDVLFPDFQVKYACVGALTQFEDKTSGIVNSWHWDFGAGNGSSSNTSSQNPYHIFTETGEYTVTLTASNNTESRSYTQEVSILANPLPPNQIILSSNTSLFSFRTASEYAWYRDGVLIPESDNRLYNTNGQPGVYFVVTKEGQCNRPSEAYVITSIEEAFGIEFRVYPNPATSLLTVEIPSPLVGSALQIKDVLGRLVTLVQLMEESTALDVSGWPKGLYLISLANGIESKKIFIH
ncbi:MAG TPA: S8 family serine peptidase [Cyclobacteriaceae bacterium]|nr:S8 family serine peptidase [Cyclobacteriaceae bacterium]HRJ83817.1 S8 family serine peptidase [Cyclobacteriaceae bacterium]